MVTEIRLGVEFKPEGASAHQQAGQHPDSASAGGNLLKMGALIESFIYLFILPLFLCGLAVFLNI